MINKNYYRIAVIGITCTALISSLGVVVMTYQGKSATGVLELALTAIASLGSLLVVPPAK